MHIYLHIPFCESKCPYCAFASFTDKNSQIKDYFGALKLDLKHQLNLYNPNNDKKIKTLYIGGGTPSYVNAKFYEDIISLLSPYFDKQIEFSVEANPSSLSASWLKTMKSFGVNRLSIGVQSFDDEKLRFLKRIHSSKLAKDKISLAKQYIDDISIDLIYATKFDTKEFLKKELNNLPDEINHLSAYTLILEENTPFFGKKSYQKTSIKNIEFFIKSLKDMGFMQYEISNFTKTKPSFHNKAYWQGKDYIGAGFGAVGFMKDKRFYHKNDLDFYIKNPIEKKVEKLNKDDLFLERLFLGFRSDVGVKASEFSKDMQERLKLLEKEGKITIKNGMIFNNNFLLADEIAIFLANF